MQTSSPNAANRARIRASPPAPLVLLTPRRSLQAGPFPLIHGRALDSRRDIRRVPRLSPTGRCAGTYVSTAIRETTGRRASTAGGLGGRRVLSKSHGIAFEVLRFDRFGVARRSPPGGDFPQRREYSRSISRTCAVRVYTLTARKNRMRQTREYARVNYALAYRALRRTRRSRGSVGHTTKIDEVLRLYKVASVGGRSRRVPIKRKIAGD